MGLTFPNVLGLAAGFDKNAVGIDALAALGFGHVEIGTVTGEPQPGNDKPRLFRLPADRAVVNRMGFNNDGAEAVARRLAERTQDLDKLDRAVGPPGRSSASTSARPRSCRRTRRSATTRRARGCWRRTPTTSSSTSARRTPPACATSRPSRSSSRCWPPCAPPPTTSTDGRRVPLLVKIAPDLDDDDVLAVADLAIALGLDGIIATNTTISRDGLATDRGDGRADRRRRPVRAAPHRALARGAPAAEGPGRRRPHPGRRRRHHHRRRRPRPARRRRDPAPGLHRVRLRGPAVAAAHPEGSRPASAGAA